MAGIITWVADVISNISAARAFGFLVILYVISSILSWYRLRHIKGPFLASFSYLWIMCSTATGRQSEQFRAVIDKYGPLSRIGPNDLITGDPEIIRRMGRTSGKVIYRRSGWYSSTKVDLYHDSLFTTRDTVAHDRLKAKMSFGYGGRENPTLEASIDTQLAAWVDLIRRKYISVGAELEPIDMAITEQYFTLDSLSNVAYGDAFGFLAADGDMFDYISETEKLVPFLALSGEVPWAGKVLLSSTFLKLFGPKTTDKSGFGVILKLAYDLTQARHAPSAQDERDMLGAFIRHGVGKRDYVAEVPFQIVAGSDTTATAIRGTLRSLMAGPHAYQNLQREIDDAVTNGTISKPIRAEEARKLPHLQAVIYEGLRINITFSGLRSSAVFGNDAGLFRPERWLEIDEAERVRWRQHVELVFGSGRWGCSGKPVAFLELIKVSVELFRRFDMQLVYPGRPMETVNKNMFFQKNLWVRVTERFPELPE
ncbi:hypothetical protein VUR80DRAFT_4184 [Thermomyces stellatus]